MIQNVNRPFCMASRVPHIAITISTTGSDPRIKVTVRPWHCQLGSTINVALSNLHDSQLVDIKCGTVHRFDMEKGTQPLPSKEPYLRPCVGFKMARW